MSEITYQSPTQLVLKRFFKHRFAPVALFVFFCLLCSAIFAFLSHYTPTQQNPHEAYQPPSAQHWFGTDELGRDVYTRILYGGRISLSVGLVATLLTLLIGVVVGSISGYYGGWLDNVLMRITDAFLSFPAVLVLILISSLLREMPLVIMNNSVIVVIIVIAALSWMWSARLVRSLVLPCGNANL
jgi:peptide/nickel transport system permease protein